MKTKIKNYVIQCHQDLFNFTQMLTTSLKSAPRLVLKTTALYASFGFSYGGLYGSNLVDVDSSRKINCMLANELAFLFGSNKRSYYVPEPNDESVEFYNFIQPFYETTPTIVSAYAAAGALAFGTIGFFRSAKHVYNKVVDQAETCDIAQRNNP